ncbi:MAG: tetratricopeptide repeat protein [Cyclobacteriaceae bacterium]
MLRTRILLVVSACVLVFALYLLPKAVVDNSSEISESTQGTTVPQSHKSIEPLAQKAINQLRLLVDRGPIDQNNLIFADSLASAYISASRFDSAAMYLDRAASFIGTPERQVQAGDAWYQASTFSMEAETRSSFASKAQELFKKALEKQPSNPDIKVKLALTFMTTSAPMQGVTLLREVLAENPKHEKALLNMGMLSIQSGQFAKAIEWLTKLTESYPENVEGQLLLGASYAGAGDKEKARAQYERTKNMTKDPAVQQQLDQYIKDLK